jgi:hypothetical protein
MMFSGVAGCRRASSCLGHKLRGVEGTYNTHDYLNERRAALESWTALLLDIESGAQKVTPIRRRRRKSMSRDKVASVGSARPRAAQLWR